MYPGRCRSRHRLTPHELTPAIVYLLTPSVNTSGGLLTPRLTTPGLNWCAWCALCAGPSQMSHLVVIRHNLASRLNIHNLPRKHRVKQLYGAASECCIHADRYHCKNLLLAPSVRKFALCAPLETAQFDLFHAGGVKVRGSL